MKTIIRKYFAAVFSIAIVSQLKTGLVLENGWQNTASAAALLTVILFIKPLIDALMLPLNLLTLNLTNWLMYITLIFIWSLLSWQVNLTTFNFQGAKIGPIALSAALLPAWQAGILSALLVVLILKFFGWLFR
ncbi:MAG: hypothetical protein UV73_C0002G0037 [Candidatus Gottesmanbacteria bacterium GW2011_GWA2_43_14]|uniref:Uncharacterized protein n=1 Tax=Candidatus Gottesmanbacteria bacterium GW2011_GWA2_43_14 TaxID=1618443 RepID=A0A0G1GHQ7_9BACT|nr:MAG: hypothetical protein UV73_C0002G0037 [Candidatus Gottesmanbacteria bacterium GW2011_GWA2_43_14]